jgi:hypothetical protein
MVALVVVLLVAGSVGIGAARIGYSGLTWFFLSLIGGPFTLGLFSALPDRKLAARRKADLASLRLELEEAGAVAPVNGEVPQETIGDLATLRG